MLSHKKCSVVEHHLQPPQLFYCSSQTEGLSHCPSAVSDNTGRSSSVMNAWTIGIFPLRATTNIVTLAPFQSIVSIILWGLEVYHSHKHEQLFIFPNHPVHKIFFLLNDPFTELSPLLFVCFSKWLHGSDSKELALAVDSQDSPCHCNAERQLWCGLSRDNREPFLYYILQIIQILCCLFRTRTIFGPFDYRSGIFIFLLDSEDCISISN